MSPYIDREQIVHVRRRRSSVRAPIYESSPRQVYIERRESTISADPRTYSTPIFYPGYEAERGRSVSSSRSSSRRESREDARMMRYSRSESRASSTTAPSLHSRNGSQSSSHRASKGALIVPCSTACADVAARRDSAAQADAKAAEEDPDWSTDEEERKQKKRRNKRLLYTSLAGITTVAAANNIYQSSKAHKERTRDVRTGVMCEAEAKHKRNKALAMDLFSVGVAAIGINNAVNGWKTTGKLRDDDHKAQERWSDKQSERRELEAWRRRVEER